MGVYPPTGGVPYIYIRYANGVIYIQAWASALLVLTIMGNPEPQSVGRVMVRLPRFFRIWHFKNNYKQSVQGESD